MKKLSLAVIAISTAMLSTSCLREIDNFEGVDGKFVSFKVTAENVSGTKAGSDVQGLEMVDLSENGHNLYLFGSVQPNNLTPFGPVTKATADPYTSEYASKVDEFYVKMNNTEGVAKKETISLGDIWYMYKDGEKVVWDDESASASFLAYYLDSNSDNSASFVANSNKVYFEGDGSEDFLLAYQNHKHNDSTYPTTTENYVPLTFKHPLALVKFRVTDDVNVSHLSVNNATTSGWFEFDSNGNIISESDSDFPLSYIYTEDLDDSKEISFYVMPCDFEKDDISVTFYFGTDKSMPDYILSTKNLGVDEWKSGFIYNYTISDSKFPNEVDVEIINDNVVVQNDFTNAVYLRAAVVANWVDAKRRIVEAWNPNDDSIEFNTFELGWVLNEADGYFYHVQPVLGYKASDALISKISASKKDGLTLQVSVAVQAVGYDHDKANAIAAWGEDIEDLIGGLQ